MLHYHLERLNKPALFIHESCVCCGENKNFAKDKYELKKPNMSREAAISKVLEI